MRLICLASVLAFCGTPVQAADPSRVTLNIPSMNCPLCPLTVSRALRKMPGVLEVTAELSTKSARISYDPEKVSPERLAQAVSDAGYPATPSKP